MLLLKIESTFKDYKEFCTYTFNHPSDTFYIKKTLSIAVLCGMLYGFIMGMYNSILQAFVSAIKVPLLFFATLAICITLLHFIGLLFGSKLKFLQTTSVLVHGISISMILLSAFAPISLFFMLTHSIYKFILLMHVLFFAFAGATGLFFIKRNFTILRELEMASLPHQNTDVNTRSDARILTIWMLLYMFVGTQMAYILSPFIGTDSTFMLFNGSDNNFYTYLLNQIFG